MLKRIHFMMGFFLVVFGLLLGKLFFCQIIQGQTLTAQVIKMRSQSIALREFPRGEILDRNQQSLTRNTGFSSLYCRIQAIPVRDGSRAAGCRELAKWLGTRLQGSDAAEFYERLVRATVQKKLLVKLHEELSQEEIRQLQATPHPALEIVPQWKRYRQDGLLAHVIGYVSAGGEGQAGLEKNYDELLQGGVATQEILLQQDGRGQAIPGINVKVRSTDKATNALGLTIDARVQQAVENIMDQRIARGAVVVMEVHSKEILAMASRPTYNQYRVQEYLADLRSPLLNRTLSSYYPGSVFKIVVSTALVEENLVRQGETFRCSGQYVFNQDLAIPCWKEEGHGEVSFEQAFAGSCNPTFIQLGLRLGKNRLLQYVDQLHLTNPELSGLPGQQKDSYVSIDPGDPAMANACLGQRGVMLTPVQIASLLATIADDGCWSPPQLVKYTLDGSGQMRQLDTVPGEQVIRVATAQKIQSMLAGVVTDGTGQAARLDEVAVAGKTATSQTGRIKENGEEVLNTWFAGYLPADAPRWVIVVLAEEGKSGAENCAPVFKEIARELLAINP
ncbi:MAG TPA: penicillin-binding protein 2 [Syntrophomonas sp.]|nr:penicillin-binding protein 2 [Syntrophomonas sp.]HRW12339.1 penicillin-binding protein 2 [Syntrophomonas sp.]